jgi:hypothetical protein
MKCVLRSVGKYSAAQYIRWSFITLTTKGRCIFWSELIIFYKQSVQYAIKHVLNSYSVTTKLEWKRTNIIRKILLFLNFLLLSPSSYCFFPHQFPLFYLLPIFLSYSIYSPLHFPLFLFLLSFASFFTFLVS